jgi:hypothetical protein
VKEQGGKLQLSPQQQQTLNMAMTQFEIKVLS